jgi:hypothetical protein
MFTWNRKWLMIVPCLLAVGSVSGAERPLEAVEDRPQPVLNEAAPQKSRPQKRIGAAEKKAERAAARAERRKGRAGKRQSTPAEGNRPNRGQRRARKLGRRRQPNA